MTRRTIIAAATSLLLIAACSGELGGTSGRTVTAAEYGDRWPFPGVESGTIECEPPGSNVVIHVPGRGVFAVNGRARGSEEAQAGTWQDALDLTPGGVATGAYGDFIDIGLEFCD